MPSKWGKKRQMPHCAWCLSVFCMLGPAKTGSRSLVRSIPRVGTHLTRGPQCRAGSCWHALSILYIPKAAASATKLSKQWHTKQTHTSPCTSTSMYKRILPCTSTSTSNQYTNSCTHISSRRVLIGLPAHRSKHPEASTSVALHKATTDDRNSAIQTQQHAHAGYKRP
eukprot:543238-Pelagomonas_calceolata.AAC.3